MARFLSNKCLFIFFLVLALPVQATCNFLSVSSIPNATAESGVSASFPIVIRNQGPNLQRVYLSTQQLPAGVSAYPIPSDYALSSGEEKTFNVIAKATASGEYKFIVEIGADQGLSTCYEYANLTLEVTPATSPTPTPLESVEVTLDPAVPKQVFQGETASYDIFLQNNYNEEVIVSLDTPDNFFQGSTTFSESVFRVAAGSRYAVKAKVTVPPGAPGGSYPVVFRAKVSTACCIQEFLLPTTVVVYGEQAKLSFLRVPLSCITVKQGKTQAVELGLQNDGEVTGPFALEVKGNEESIEPVDLQLRRLELQPGERVYFNVTLFPVERMPADLYRFSLRANYLGYTLQEIPFCYRVEGTKVVEIEKPLQSTVKRCATSSTPFTVRNVGTLNDTYAFEPRLLRGVKATFDPTRFSLASGQSRDVKLVLGASCVAPLGKQALEVKIIASEFRKTEVFDIMVLANESLQQFLKVDSPDRIKAVEGRTKEFEVSVTNTLSIAAANTSVSVEGIPDEWVEAGSAKTIRSGATATYSMRLLPETPGEYEIAVLVTSGLEQSRQPLHLSVEPQSKQLDYSYDLDFSSDEDKTQEVHVQITVKNTGNVELSDISVSTSAEDVNVVSADRIAYLAPGETRSVSAVLQPLQSTPAKSIPLRLYSKEGIGKTQTVALPAMTRVEEKAGFEFPWKVAAIVVLLVLIFALLSKGEEGAYQV